MTRLVRRGVCQCFGHDWITTDIHSTLSVTCPVIYNMPLECFRCGQEAAAIKWEKGNGFTGLFLAPPNNVCPLATSESAADRS
jgi:hypothetical protein